MSKPFTLTKAFVPFYHGGMENTDSATAAPFEYDDPALWRLVPASVREIAKHIGRQGAIALCTAFRGENITIPSRENANPRGAAKFQRLADAIGEEAARQLCAEYGGTRLAVPTMSAAKSAARCRSIERFVAAKVAEGASQRDAINEAARVFEMTSRAIENNLVKVV